MRRLESLESWKVARRVAERVYRLTLESPAYRHRALVEQLRRAALSVPANIAEGYALATRRQLIRHLRIALGSCNELRCHLEIGITVQAIPHASGTNVLEECDRLTGLLIGLLKRLGARAPGV
jgi:four helix bundle protein